MDFELIHSNFGTSKLNKQESIITNLDKKCKVFVCKTCVPIFVNVKLFISIYYRNNNIPLFFFSDNTTKQLVTLYKRYQ